LVVCFGGLLGWLPSVTNCLVLFVAFWVPLTRLAALLG
jgi:hypothetical protein